jgi:hypothetical protein
MLSKTHFYHRITRKLVVGFGTLFNNIQLYRYNKAGNVEIERIVVPLSYTSKEKFYTRITQDSNLNKEVQITLPRMSFEMTSINYDPLRKTSIFNNLYSESNNFSAVKQTPYNFTFTLSVYARNTEDGTQIIEQILPYFSPDYTLTVDLNDLNGLNVDVPVILDSINYTQDYQGSSDTTRVLVWDLTFTVKAYLYGPTQSNTKVIRTATANIFNSFGTTSSDRYIQVNNGNNLNYKIGELVYVGRDPMTATASAFVMNWSNTANNMMVTRSFGEFKANTKLVGAVSNAVYTIVDSSDKNLQLVNIDVTPIPSTANANNAFGFDINIEEYPNIT